MNDYLRKVGDMALLKEIASIVISKVVSSLGFRLEYCQLQ